MPIYEFKCLKCNELFELLVMNNDETTDMCCPTCKAPDFERVLSTASYAMGSGGSKPKVNSNTRTCSGGSCTTYNVPGHTRD